MHESVAEEFVEGVRQIFEQSGSKLGGDPLSPETTHGPVIDKAQFDSIMSFIAVGRQDASIVPGGARQGEKGYHIHPTLFMNPDLKSKIWTDEIFGPVLSVKTFKTEEEAIELANKTLYGLAGKLSYGVTPVCPYVL